MDAEQHAPVRMYARSAAERFSGGVMDTVMAMCACLQGAFAGLVYASDATFKSGTVRCGKCVFRVRRAVPGTGFAFKCYDCNGSGWLPMDRALAEELEYPFRAAQAQGRKP